MQNRSERVLIETERHRITGMVTLPRDGYRSRVSDFLNAQERDFISLTHVTVETLDGEAHVTEHDFVTVSRHHIVLATQLEPLPGQAHLEEVPAEDEAPEEPASIAPPGAGEGEPEAAEEPTSVPPPAV